MSPQPPEVTRAVTEVATHKWCHGKGHSDGVRASQVLVGGRSQGGVSLTGRVCQCRQRAIGLLGILTAGAIGLF